MKILLIGNGFDLFHNLPTRYSSFLDFSNVIANICKDETLMLSKVNEKLVSEISVSYNLQKISETSMKEYVKYLKNENPTMKDKLYRFLEGNTWLKYFNKIKKLTGNCWVDFEGEISNVVQAMDKCYNCTDTTLNKDYIQCIETISVFDTKKKGLLSKNITMYSKKEIIEMRDLAHKDLERLTGALEIYLNDYVEKLDIDYTAPELENESFDKLLSFNYTSTYEKVYGHNCPNLDCEYIHGKADATDDTVSMVLGIDEYLEGDKIDTDTTFIRFKKYFQILQKRTAFKYKSWIKQINNSSQMSTLTIFGHSLNYSDKEILRAFILNEKVNTKIYYYSEGQYGRLLENLIRVIGKENTIAYVGESPDSKIRFIKQSEKVLNK